MSKRHIMFLLLSLASLCSVWLAFFAFDSWQAIYVVKNFGYWLMLANVSVVLFLAYKRYSGRFGRIFAVLRQRKPVVVFVVVCAGILQVLQPHGFKIVMDEPVLASTALRMHEYQEVMVTVRAHQINGVFRQLDGYVDKRPFFYPFLVSLLHDVVGFHADNPIVLNGLLSILFLAILFHTGEQCCPQYGGYLSVALLMTMPLLAMSATGGGFGILNLVMILLVAQLGITYLNDLRVDSMNLLIFMGLLLTQTRYESVLFVLPIALVVLLGWMKSKQMQISKLTLCAPFLMVPFGLQRVIFDGSALAYELREGAAKAFSFAYIPDNLVHAAEFFFNWKTVEYANSALLSWCFIAAVMLLLHAIFSRRITIDVKQPIIVVLLGFSVIVIFNFFLLMAYHWGQLNDIMATRIALPFILFQSLVCVVAVRAIAFRLIAVKAIFAVLVTFFIGFTVPSTAKNDYLQWVPGRHEAIWVQQQSKELKERNVLLISNTHLMSIAERVPTIAQFWAKKNKAKLKLHLDMHTYEAVYLFHMMVADPRGGEGMLPATPVYRDYDLELITESKLGEKRFIRMSRITDVRLSAQEGELLKSLKRLPETDLERLAFVAETLP
ncbi:MAG: glycosyltransferase family 39 protein [Lentimonas sp.]